jgi:hypothetical protein
VRRAGKLHVVPADLGIGEITYRPIFGGEIQYAVEPDWIEVDARVSIEQGLAVLLSRHAAFDEFMRGRDDAAD